MNLLIKPLFCLSVLCIGLLAQSAVEAQSVKITPRKVVYKRTGSEVPDFRRSFMVRYPMFGGNVPGTVLDNLKNYTDYWRIFEINLEENLKDDYWLTSLDYRVPYNRNNVLEIVLTMEGVGAYPDASSKQFVFDLRTGNKVGFEDAFTQLTRLRDIIRVKMRHQESMLTREMRKELALQRKMNSEGDYYPSPEKLELKDLEGFSVSDRGITFLYDYEFPHVVQALEPSGRFYFTWIQLRPYIRRDGLLARFIR